MAFAKNPNNLDRIVALDDSVVWGALSLMAEANDATVKDLAARLRDRRLYKCVDVRERLLTRLGEDVEDEVAEQACQRVEQKISEWLDSKTDIIPRIISDRAERQPYRRFQESKGPLNQIRIKTSGGELVDLVRRSKVVAAIRTFKLYRVYLDNDDVEARQFVEQAINAEGSNADAG